MTTPTTLTPGQVHEIPIGKLVPDPGQPRKVFDEPALARLAASLKRRVQVPLLVRATPKGKYMIVDGERRWRAAKLAKLKALPVLLVSADPGEPDALRLDQVAVNNLREQLTTMEVARMLADLRQQHFATINDLAAALDKRGLPAMTPEQIQQTIDLTALPDWLQAMIDARQVEAPHALKLRVLEPWPAALASAKEHLGRVMQWRGRVTADDIRSAIGTAAGQNGARIHTEQWDRNPAHFNPTTVCRGCDQKLVLGSDRFCMAPEEFDRKNAEAKAAGLLPGGKKPPKKGPVEPGSAVAEQLEAQKAAGREATLETKARDYLHAYLVCRICDLMRADIDIAEELLIWRAMERPGEDRAGPNAFGGRHDGAKAAGIRGLEDLLAATDLAAAKHEAAAQVARELYWRETQVICHKLWGTEINKVWGLDEDFLQLFRKAELVRLAEEHDLKAPEGKEWARLKLGELRAEILMCWRRAHLVQRPKLLQHIYGKVAAPYVPWSRRQDDGPACIGCGCTDEDGCEEGCEWVRVDVDEAAGARIDEREMS